MLRKQTLRILISFICNNYRSFQNMVVHHYAKRYNISYVLQAHGSAVTYSQKGHLKRVFDMLGGNDILRDAVKNIAVSSIEVEQYERLG